MAERSVVTDSLAHSLLQTSSLSPFSFSSLGIGGGEGASVVWC